MVLGVYIAKATSSPRPGVPTVAFAGHDVPIGIKVPGVSVNGTSTYDYREWLPQLSCPSLVFLGEEGVLSEEEREELLSFYSFSRVQIWAGADHGLHEDDPERFVLETRSFLDSFVVDLDGTNPGN